MMNFTVILRTIEFALIGKESLHNLAPQAAVCFRRSIIDYGVPLSATFSDDAQYGFGVPHLAYLSTLLIRSPGLLRRVRGFPALRLL